MGIILGPLMTSQNEFHWEKCVGHKRLLISATVVLEYRQDAKRI